MTSSGHCSVIHAAGGILQRRMPSGDEVMIVHRKRYGDWTLPKGKLKDGESFLEAAVREVREETGCLTEPSEYLGAVSYEVNKVPKVVLFWRMSLLQQDGPGDKEEIAEAVWLQIPDAVQRLTHAQEKALLWRAAGCTKQYQSPGKLDLPPLQHRRSWFRGEGHRARLLRELLAFRLELAFLEQRSQEADAAWAAAARDQLANAERYLETSIRHIEGGWLCLHAARRNAVFGLSRAELANRACILREESQKISSWRGKAMEKLLSVADDQLTADRVAEAMAQRDEYAGNQYHKIWLMADQLRVLLWICGLALPLLLPLVFFQRQLQPWGYQLMAAVLFFGLLGAAFSAGQSLITDTGGTRIPERVANHFVTIIRTLLGSVAGLAGYAFLESKILNIKVGEDDVGTALAIAFLFGYTGERLVARVAGSMGGGKSQS